MTDTAVMLQGEAGEIRAGLFSPWNVRSGIAEYSKLLLGGMEEVRLRWTIFAPYDADLVRPDGDNVIRYRDSGKGRIAGLLDALEMHPLDVLVVQFDARRVSSRQLDAVVACCHSVGIRLHMILHGTACFRNDKAKEGFAITADLATVDGILVHSPKDVDWLNKLGVSRNVHLLPHGTIEFAQIDREEARIAHGAIRHEVETFWRDQERSRSKLSANENRVLRDLQRAVTEKKLRLPDDDVIIGSYGFLLPHKGIEILLRALAVLRLGGMPAKLLLVNAEHQCAASSKYLAACRALAKKLEITEHVIFEPEFRPNEISLARLAACDVLVFPYEDSVGSSSTAVRMGLASRRPVLCSAEPIFADVAEAVLFLDENSPQNIAQHVRALSRDSDGLAHLSRQQEALPARRPWSLVVRELEDIVATPVTRVSDMERTQATTRFVAALVGEREAGEAEVKALREQFIAVTAQLDAARQQAATAAARERELAVSKAWLEWANSHLEHDKAHLEVHLAQRERVLTAALEENRDYLTATLNETRERLTAALKETTEQLAAARTEIGELSGSLHYWRTTAEQHWAELQSIYHSRSWWLTKPVRLLGRLRRLRGSGV